MAAMRAQDIYNEYVKPLPKAERARLLALLAEDAAQQSNEPPAARHSIMELHGLGKGVWQEIDAQQYVDELRHEWEDQP